MQDLSYGFQKPETGDFGSVWWTAMSANIQKLNDHTHDGSDSSQIASTDLTPVTQSLSSASWGGLSNGLYSQLVTVPPAILELNDYKLTFKLASGTESGSEVGLSYTRVTATSFRVYCNDNAVSLTAIYG